MTKARTPSDFVGPNVRRFRELRNWRQRHLVERLRELGATTTGWSEVKVHRLETGKRQKVSLEDLFELALALDVSPLQLVVPHGDEAALVRVTVGGRIDRPAHLVKQWVRGVKFLLSSVDYKDDEEAARAQRFYLVDSQPLGEWGLIAESGKYASRIQRSLEVLEESTDAE